MSQDPSKTIGRVRLVLLDVDGVLTDGRLGLSSSGEEIRFFSTRDGLGIRMALEAGIEVGFLSGRKSRLVDLRARELGVRTVIQGSRDKVADFQRLIKRKGLEPGQVAFMGDDLPDIALLQTVGFSAAPCDATEEVRLTVDFVSEKRGGHGAVREILDLIRKSVKSGQDGDAWF